MGKKVERKTDYESVKINKKVVELVRQNKKITRVPISAFFEKAALNELKFQQKK
jgi:hypothetical protein